VCCPNISLLLGCCLAGRTCERLRHGDRLLAGWLSVTVLRGAYMPPCAAASLMLMLLTVFKRRGKHTMPLCMKVTDCNVLYEALP
jgi:hypothetical protein